MYWYSKGEGEPAEGAVEGAENGVEGEAPAEGAGGAMGFAQARNHKPANS